MDAQNAPGSDKTKPAASPTRAGGTQPDGEQIKKTNNSDGTGLSTNDDAAVKTSTSTSTSTITNPPSKSTGVPVPPEHPRHSRLDIQSTPDLTARSTTPAVDNNVDSANGDRDSDAETIVLPGKDGHSPSKVRKVKHEDGSDGDGDALDSRKPRESASAKDGNHAEKKATSGGDKSDKSRSEHGLQEKKHLEKFAKANDGSSGLSSAPASPPDHRRPRRRTVHDDSDSDSDSKQRHIRKPSANKARAKSTDQVLSPQKRKAYRAESGGEAEDQKSARRRHLDARGDWVARDERSTLRDGKSSQRDHKPPTSSKTHADANNQRSTSPSSRAHRRSVSTHLPSQPSSNGVAQKKRRLPPPLRSTEYHSDESSASGSPHPRNVKMRKLSTPATADANPSPARAPASKKHVDAHGQTPLARACNKGEYEVAKQRLEERPEDLNIADYAGNTPLQSAAIHGYEDIVKLLIDAGCSLDCVNEIKDTPLLDAVDNGHLGVVKLLLDAGVNPRKANLEGEEPLDRVNDEFENADEIRAALIEAKQRHAEVRRTSEEHQAAELNDNRSSNGPESPRHSPGATSLGRRPTASRATKTSNHHLYVNLDAKTLRAAAARGDEETVTRVLQVRDNCDDPAAMVAAARGGHEVVLQLLLALGGANPDPPPVRGMAQEVGTPMLAAIGQENINVIQLLLSQQNFDPTRRFRGEYYYEIARRRQGTNWKEEEQLLKNAFDAYRKAQRENKTKSPGRRERERVKAQERETKRAGRTTGKEEPRSGQRNPGSPPRETEAKKLSTSGWGSADHEDQTSSPKRAAGGKAKKDERNPAATLSDEESSPAASRKSRGKAKIAESDMAGLSSEGETVKPRRKLVSKGELREEREKQRRASIMSSASSLKDHPPSPREPRHDDHAEKPKGERVSEKYHDRTKAIKRDESRDKLPASGEHGAKRHRSSVTPPHSGISEKDGSETPAKRRRIDAEGKERRPKASDLVDEQQPKPARDVASKPKSVPRDVDDGSRKQPHQSGVGPSDSQGHEAAKSNPGDKPSVQVKSEDMDVEMPDVPPSKQAEESEERAQRERQEEKKKRREAEAEEARRNEDAQRERAAEKKRREEQEYKRREEERRRREAEEEERKRKAAEDEKRERERKRLEEEERLKREAEERERERKRREEEKRRAEEEKRRAEEEKRRVEEEKRRLEEEERERRRKEEEDKLRRQRQQQREEEERLRQEQLEREAAEQARLRREEEERKEREHRERVKREEAERKRAAHEEAMRRAREEQERQEQVAKRPALLRWLDSCPNPQAVAERFKSLHGVRYDTIRHEARGTPEGREQWVLNVQVALLLGIKDLDLARYPEWERIPVPNIAKNVVWCLVQDEYALTRLPLRDLGATLPDYYDPGPDPYSMYPHTMVKLRNATREQFLGMDMFFVKLSDLMHVVPNFPHLRDVTVTVHYRELPESEADWRLSKYPGRWKQDPDAGRYYGFAPQATFWVNGVKGGERLPGFSAVSREPFPERRAPRRGLVQVFPDDPDYARICKEQGLEHLLEEQRSASRFNGAHPSPISATSGREHENVPDSSNTDHDRPSTASVPVVDSSKESQTLVNGVHGLRVDGAATN